MGSYVYYRETLCFYSGLKLISDTHHTLLSKEKSFFMAACEADPRCFGQLYTKCRRSGYTNVCSSVLVDEATQVKDKLLGIQSKTGKDSQENIFMKKVVAIFKYPSSNLFKTVLPTHVWSWHSVSRLNASRRIIKRQKLVTPSTRHQLEEHHEQCIRW